MSNDIYSAEIDNFNNLIVVIKKLCKGSNEFKSIGLLIIFLENIICQKLIITTKKLLESSISSLKIFISHEINQY